MRRFRDIGPQVYYAPDEGGGAGEGGSEGEGGEAGGDSGGGEATFSMPGFQDWIKTTDYAEAPWVKDTPDFETFAKRFSDQQKLVSGDRVTLPKEGDADDQERFWNEMGRPEKATGYDLGDWAPPDGVEWDPGFQSTMLERLHARGLSNAHARGVIQDYGDLLKAQSDERNVSVETGRREAETKLAQEWGTNYEGRKQGAIKMFEEVFGEEFAAIAQQPMADGSIFGNRPEVLRGMAELAQKVGEHGLLGDKAADAGMTPEQAESKIKEIESNAEFKAILSTDDKVARQSHPLFRQWRDLMKIAHD